MAIMASWLPLNPARPPAKSEGVTHLLHEVLRHHAGGETFDPKVNRSLSVSLVLAVDRSKATAAVCNEHAGEAGINVALGQNTGTGGLQSGLNSG